MRKDGQTDGHDEANRPFFLLLRVPATNEHFLHDKFYENPPSGSPVCYTRTDGRTNTHGEFLQLFLGNVSQYFAARVLQCPVLPVQE